ncbi:pectin lyase-like superfamily protein [Artemisia annua]|uniref:Pectin lyase-like superfamily protein n=1 Tax=Artemisia annua TaxID=35608 RepID=A0A2U1MT27_ARTAN|nr:pectin lyase-like superfamily protein [Artemisia annua]
MNNDITEWKMYSIQGSADPTINSQGNRYTTPAKAYSKEVWLVGDGLSKEEQLKAAKHLENVDSCEIYMVSRIG